MIIDGNRMYRETVERDSFAARGRKRVNSGKGDARLYIASAMDNQIDNFFNRDEVNLANIFNQNNRYYVNLFQLRSHIIQSMEEWQSNITNTDYRDVTINSMNDLLREIDETINLNGILSDLGELERNAGGIAHATNTGSIRIYVRPLDGANVTGWRLLRESILRVSRIQIQRFPNQEQGFDYHFSLEVHPDYHGVMGGGEFEIIRDITEKNPDFDPNNLEDLTRRVEREVVYRQGQADFRDRIRNAYGDICAITGCDDERGMQAAHIMRYRGEQTNHVTNGMLLRIDIHRLFDHPNGPFLRIEIDEDTWRIRIDESLIGTTYEQYDGTELNLPQNPAHRPNIEAVRNAGWLVN